MKKIRWGILSTAKIGLENVIPAMQLGTYCDIVAIASRNLKKAQSAATQLNIPTAYGSYEELLADPNIDAVYIPLPNQLHVDWSIKSLNADKHVLCEKPIALTANEAQKLLDASHQKPHLKVMEAFMYRHHPQWQRVRQILLEGKIGQPKTIQSFFSYYNKDPGDIRNQADVGGGGLMDIGCYCISFARFIFGSEPVRVLGTMQCDPDFNTDWLTSGILEFSSGSSTFTCSTQINSYQRINIFGSEGRIDVEIPVNAPPDKPSKIFLQHKNETEEIIFDACDQYTIQGDSFSKAILDNSEVLIPLEDAVANMHVIDSIVQSATSGEWVKG